MFDELQSDELQMPKSTAYCICVRVPAMISDPTLRRTSLYRSLASLLQRGVERCPASRNEHREAGRAACLCMHARQGREAIKQPQSAQRTGRLRLGQWMPRLML